MYNTTPYAGGTTRADVERALFAAGKKLDRLEATELAMLEDFHTGGRLATAQLADLVTLRPGSRVLDAGSSIGGTARYLAGRFGCTVTAVDLVDDYCETARWLNHLVGLENRIVVRRADVTALPFPDASFDAVFSQHVQMNVEPKDTLYREARRVLATGGQLALWDLTTDNSADRQAQLDYPQPWANTPEDSHLTTPADLRATVEAAGFTVTHWADLTDQVAATMRIVQSLPRTPLGLHAFVPDFPDRLKNLTEALSEGCLRAIQAVARAD